MRDTEQASELRDGDVVLGDDWVIPQDPDSAELGASRRSRNLFSLRGSPLARKIITFNLIALVILVTGLLYLDDSRDEQVKQTASNLMGDAQLVSNVFEAQLRQSSAAHSLSTAELDVKDTLAGLSLPEGGEVFVYDAAGTLIGWTRGGATSAPMPNLLRSEAEVQTGSTLISDALNAVWKGLSKIFTNANPDEAPTLAQRVQSLIPTALQGQMQVQAVKDAAGETVIVAASPISLEGSPVGAVAMAGPAGEIDALARREQERILQMFVVALLVSIGLSLVLASTIANPLADLAAAAESGKDRGAGVNPGRIRIPDLSARPDEIGRLSRALRGMVNALYNRIDSNEQFAADVSHEIKNPLASLQSAVGTLRMVKREDQREKLLSVIEHDVRRLDRLVSDISNASRLDAELVKEEEQLFDLLKLLGNISQYLGEEARGKGVDYITDLPSQPIEINGLEARLAQVFVNLITNAISFCESGDAIRVWVRRRENRVLIVVEDTGPGIPEQALTKVFKRFYSQRPVEHFGNNSGLGLAISKQIVEAHGGVIWAENIRPTEADVTSDPLGARFVVGLPV
ncbi:Alkaline phosphatase synthesis sensor protein PhoR [Ruegeria sp. THAF57]|uniref:sensor histidine kinase n=1 Tax=Ruegeria sp. THAF57 TaxID=2744555 RepID=UPI0015DF1F9E|nr:sensor histidine kinase [Ruegeria sp. THAF57]CAD0186452.1 Alkaline phosphatase synthesis sensor protein PhoR [Ruegeria sp. THAF57]